MTDIDNATAAEALHSLPPPTLDLATDPEQMALEINNKLYMAAERANLTMTPSTPSNLENYHST